MSGRYGNNFRSGYDRGFQNFSGGGHKNYSGGGGGQNFGGGGGQNYSSAGARSNYSGGGSRFNDGDRASRFGNSSMNGDVGGGFNRLNRSHQRIDNYGPPLQDDYDKPPTRGGGGFLQFRGRSNQNTTLNKPTNFANFCTSESEQNGIQTIKSAPSESEEERRRLQDFGWNENENSTLKKADGTDKESVEMTKILKQAMEISSEPIKGRDENDVQKTYDKLQGKVDDPVEFPPIRDADQIDLSTSKNEASCTAAEILYEPFKEKTEMEVKNAEEPEVEIVNGAMHTSPVVIETVKIDPSPLNKEPPSSDVHPLPVVDNAVQVNPTPLREEGPSPVMFEKLANVYAKFAEVAAELSDIYRALGNKDESAHH